MATKNGIIIMKKTHLPIVLVTILSLMGFTQSAFATTLFGFNYNFTYDSGEDAGGGFLAFEVDPDALPFDQAIDLSNVTVTQADFWVKLRVGPQAFGFNLDDITGYGSPTNPTRDPFFGTWTVQDLNPIFPVLYNQPFSTGGDSALGFSNSGVDLRLMIDGSVVANGPIGGLPGHSHLDIASWSVGAWFDDPIPPVSAVPVPAAVWLFGTGILGLIGVARRKVQV